MLSGKQRPTQCQSSGCACEIAAERGRCQLHPMMASYSRAAATSHPPGTVTCTDPQSSLSGSTINKQHASARHGSNVRKLKS